MFIRAFLAILLATFATNAMALNESTVLRDMKNIVLKGKKCSGTKENFWKIQGVKTKVHLKYWKKGDYTLYWSKFGCDVGKNGSVVIAPGRTESSVEYYETAIDFVNKGFSPVYVIDHVSQGFSPRLLADHHKGHIYRFSDYINAFDDAVKVIQKDLKKEGRTDEPLFFTSNSMGGAIGVGYFQKKGKKNPFVAAALLGPMIKINYKGFPGVKEGFPQGITHPTVWENLIYTEPGVILQAHFHCKDFKANFKRLLSNDRIQSGCSKYATKSAQEIAAKYGTSYVEGRRNFVEAFKKAPEQVMTHSRARYDMRTFLWESPKMKKLYRRAGLINPQLGAPTYQWAKQAAKFNWNMRGTYSIEKMSRMPLKIITGSKDIRAYTPDNGNTSLLEHDNFCSKVNKIKGKGTCDFLEIPNGFHELYKESRKYREPAFDAVIDHFLNAQ